MYTYCSVVSFRLLSVESSCSSSISMRRCKISTLDLWLSPSSLPTLASLSLLSAFSRSVSTTDSLCCRLAISCSFIRLSCSSSLFLASAASARSKAASASARREFSFSLIRSYIVSFVYTYHDGIRSLCCLEPRRGLRARGECHSRDRRDGGVAHAGMQPGWLERLAVGGPASERVSAPCLALLRSSCYTPLHPHGSISCVGHCEAKNHCPCSVTSTAIRAMGLLVSTWLPASL